MAGLKERSAGAKSEGGACWCISLFSGKSTLESWEPDRATLYAGEFVCVPLRLSLPTL